MKDGELIAAILRTAGELDGIRSRGRAAFDHDPVVRRACERLVEITGDMIGSFSPEFQQEHPELPYREAKGLRNILAHHYLVVRQENVWVAVEESVPAVAAQLGAIALGREVPSTARDDDVGLSL